jgi:hypothetical protein
MKVAVLVEGRHLLQQQFEVLIDVEAQVSHQDIAGKQRLMYA